MAEIVDQPPPVRRDGVTSVQALVRADLEEREQVGIERYGTPLQPHNGRDALVDAYQEALDLACYLRQAIAERAEPDDAADLRDRWAAHVAEHGISPRVVLPPGDGEGDEDVWIPPTSDCMENRPDKPCGYCGGTLLHHRTWRCGTCGRRPSATPPVPSRLRWEIYHEDGVGALVTDLDTERWACGSASTEWEARKAALTNLAENPSGGKRDRRWADDLTVAADPRLAEMRSGWRTIEHLVGREHCTPESTIDAVRVLVERAGGQS